MRKTSLPEELAESLRAYRQRKSLDAWRAASASHLGWNAGGTEEKDLHSLVLQRGESLVGTFPMVAVNHECLAGKVRASLGSVFTLRRIDWLMSAQLNKQTQQRGDDFLPRKN
jgi:hypothetical protein